MERKSQGKLANPGSPGRMAVRPACMCLQGLLKHIVIKGCYCSLFVVLDCIDPQPPD